MTVISTRKIYWKSNERYKCAFRDFQLNGKLEVHLLILKKQSEIQTITKKKQFFLLSWEASIET